jgi:hypothetical protein
MDYLAGKRLYSILLLVLVIIISIITDQFVRKYHLDIVNKSSEKNFINRS